MSSTWRYSLITGLIFYAFPGNAATSPPNACRSSLHPTQIEYFRATFGTWNFMNLTFGPGKFEPGPGMTMIPVKVDDPEVKKWMRLHQPEKDHRQMLWMAKMIQEQKFDVLFGQEIFGEQDLEIFDRHYLANAYGEHYFPGNDTRGIGLGSFVQPNFPFAREYRSYAHLRWNDPVLDGITLIGSEKPVLKGEKNPVPVFKRDLGVTFLYSRASYGASKQERKPTMIHINYHGKSRRDRPGDGESRMWIGNELFQMGKVLDELRAEFGEDVPLVVSGDFNVGPESEEMSPIRDRLINPFQEKKFLPPMQSDLITHSFHPREPVNTTPEISFRRPYANPANPAVYSAVDQVWVNAAALALFQEIEVVQYKDEFGHPYPVPATYEERAQLPSDHRLVRWVMLLPLN